MSDSSSGCIVVSIDSLAIFVCSRCAVFLWRQLRDAPSDRRRSSFAFPGWRRFHILSCHERPDRRGHIRCITYRRWLLRSSPCRLPWACLAVGLPWNCQGGINFQRLFHVPRSSQDGLGPLCTPAVRRSRRATLESPNLTAYRFGSSLDQPGVACSW